MSIVTADLTRTPSSRRFPSGIPTRRGGSPFVNPSAITSPNKITETPVDAGANTGDTGNQSSGSNAPSNELMPSDTPREVPSDSPSTRTSTSTPTDMQERDTHLPVQDPMTTPSGST